jgi:hypothetical protein
MILQAILFVIGLFSGIMLFFAAPVVGMIAPKDLSSEIADFYASMGCRFKKRMLLIKKSNAGATLNSSRYNGDYGTERSRIAGTKMDWNDINNQMGRLYNTPIGIVHEDRATVYNPVQADLGRKLREAKKTGRWKRYVDGAERRLEYFVFGRDRRLVDLDDIKHVVNGSMPATRPSSVVGLMEKAYQSFNKRRAMEVISLILAGVGGVIVVMMASEISGGGGGGMPSFEVPTAITANVVGVIV